MRLLVYLFIAAVVVLGLMAIVSAVMLIIQFLVYVSVIYGTGWIIYKITKYFKEDKPP